MAKRYAVGCSLILCLAGCDVAGLPSGPQADGPNPDPAPAPSEEEEQETETPEPPAELPPVVYPGVPPAISGGTLVLSRDGRYAVAADPDRDLIHVVDLTTDTVRHASLMRGSEPGRVAVDGAGRAHVALRGAGAVVSLALEDASILRQAAVCALPRGIAYHEGTDALFVACASGELSALSAGALEVRWQKQLGRDLRDVVFDGGGGLFVSRHRSAELLKLSIEGELERTFKPRTSERSPFFGGGILLAQMAPPPDGDAAGVEVPVPGAPLTMEPSSAARLTTNQAGDVIMLHQRHQKDEVVIQPGGYGSGGCDTIAQTGFSRFGADGAEAPGPALATATLAVDAAFSPDGKWVAVAAAGETGLSQRKLFGEVPAGGSADFLLPGSSGSVRIYGNEAQVPSETPVCSFPVIEPVCDDEKPGQAIAVVFHGEGYLIVQSREPAQLEIYTYTEGTETQVPAFTLVRTIPLDERSVHDVGHELFHANVGGGLACATCHQEGTDDGHVWTFAGFGPRRTQNMRGGLLGTEPFHWEGDMHDLRQLVDDVMTGRMSGFSATDEDVDALGTWIDALPALRAVPARSEAAERGALLFASPATGCATCHSGPQFTNHENADVGRGEALQVPSLLGLALRAPYMHDGCAATLTQRFDPACGGGDYHGGTSQLEESEIADLVAYLETL